MSIHCPMCGEYTSTTDLQPPEGSGEAVGACPDCGKRIRVDWSRDDEVIVGVRTDDD